MLALQQTTRYYYTGVFMVDSSERLADLTEHVVDALRHVYDPEIPVNIYDLGLVYKIEILNLDKEKPDAVIEMTLTTVNCPMADMIPGMVYDIVTTRIPDLKDVDVKLVWDPPWDPSRMSEEARLELDML